MTEPQSEPEVVPLSEAAHLLGLSWSQTWRLVLQHELEGVQVRRRWFVQVWSVADYIKRAVNRNEDT